MNILDMDRASGKTTYLVIKSHTEGKRIIVANNQMVKEVQQVADWLNIEILEPVVVTELLNRQPKEHGYLIDELHMVVQTLLGVSIDTATMTSRRKLENTRKGNTYNKSLRELIPPTEKVST